MFLSLVTAGRCLPLVQMPKRTGILVRQTHTGILGPRNNAASLPAKCLLPAILRYGQPFFPPSKYLGHFKSPDLILRTACKCVGHEWKHKPIYKVDIKCRGNAVILQAHSSVAVPAFCNSGKKKILVQSKGELLQSKAGLHCKLTFKKLVSTFGGQAILWHIWRSSKLHIIFLQHRTFYITEELVWTLRIREIDGSSFKEGFELKGTSEVLGYNQADQEGPPRGWAFLVQYFFQSILSEVTKIVISGYFSFLSQTNKNSPADFKMLTANRW